MVSFVTDRCFETRISTNDLRGGRRYRPRRVSCVTAVHRWQDIHVANINNRLIYILDDLWHLLTPVGRTLEVHAFSSDRGCSMSLMPVSSLSIKFAKR